MFDTENGKTAHGLIRYSDRFKIVGVIDYVTAGRDAGEVLPSCFPYKHLQPKKIQVLEGNYCDENRNDSLHANFNLNK